MHLFFFNQWVEWNDLIPPWTLLMEESPPQSYCMQTGGRLPRSQNTVQWSVLLAMASGSDRAKDETTGWLYRCRSRDWRLYNQLAHRWTKICLVPAEPAESWYISGQFRLLNVTTLGTYLTKDFFYLCQQEPALHAESMQMPIWMKPNHTANGR